MNEIYLIIFKHKEGQLQTELLIQGPSLMLSTHKLAKLVGN